MFWSIVAEIIFLLGTGTPESTSVINLTAFYKLTAASNDSERALHTKIAICRRIINHDATMNGLHANRAEVVVVSKASASFLNETAS